MTREGFFGFLRLPAEPADHEDAQLESSLDERIVTGVAVAAAVLVVAVIAILMGTVGP